MKTNDITIEKLRKNGYKVKVIHTNLDDTDEYQHLADRVTIIQIRNHDGREYIGKARCSIKDHYNRKLGNKIALARTIQSILKDNVELSFKDSE